MTEAVAENVKDIKARSLYEQDILLWVEDTVAKLKAGDFQNLDIINLIEEVESLGLSQKKELLSRLVTLLEHILKRIYVDIPNDYNGWERTIRNQRSELDQLIETAPSLKSLWLSTFENAWRRALAMVREEYPSIDFPNKWIYSSDLNTVLTRKFW